MARTFIRQSSQIRNSQTYDGTLAAGVALETGATNIEDDLNGIRSQVSRILDLGVGNWYDAIPTVNAKTRALLTLNTDLDALEEKRMLFRSQILTDVTVTAAQNFEVLSVAGLETPTQVAAVGAVLTEGAVVAAATTFGAHNLDVVAGANAIRPDNLCMVRDGTTGDAILSSNGKVIYALIQSESAVDGHTFNDTTQRVQLSFVEENATADGLVATASADIAGKTINYSYVRRLAFTNIPSDAFLSSVFVDQSASTDVTLTNAIAGQAGAAPQTQNIQIDQAAGIFWEWRDALSASIVKITEGSGTGSTTFGLSADVDVFSSAAILNTFAQGAKFNTAGTELDVGVTAGYIESVGANPLGLRGGSDLFLDDVSQAGSTWVQTAGIKLSSNAAEWDSFKTAYGEVSLLSAITAAGASARTAKVTANVTSTTPANNDVGGVGGGTNLDTQLPDMSAGSFLTDYDVYLNGQLMDPGANAAANNDYYPGTSLVNGQLKLEMTVVGNVDKITVISYA